MLSTVLALALVSMCDLDPADRHFVPGIVEAQPQREALELVLDTAVLINPVTAIQLGNPTAAALAASIHLLSDSEDLPRFEILLHLESPERFQVEEVRDRIGRSLRLAEEAVRETVEENVQWTIARLRA